MGSEMCIRDSRLHGRRRDPTRRGSGAARRVRRLRQGQLQGAVQERRGVREEPRGRQRRASEVSKTPHAQTCGQETQLHLTRKHTLLGSELSVCRSPRSRCMRHGHAPPALPLSFILLKIKSLIIFSGPPGEKRSRASVCGRRERNPRRTGAHSQHTSAPRSRVPSGALRACACATPHARAHSHLSAVR